MNQEFRGLDRLNKLHNDLEMGPLFLGFSFLLLISLDALSSLPVRYSGKLAIRGVNYYGTAEFVFSLQDAKGSLAELEQEIKELTLFA